MNLTTQNVDWFYRGPSSCFHPTWLENPWKTWKIYYLTSPMVNQHSCGIDGSFSWLISLVRWCFLRCSVERNWLMWTQFGWSTYQSRRTLNDGFFTLCETLPERKVVFLWLISKLLWFILKQLRFRCRTWKWTWTCGYQTGEINKGYAIHDKSYVYIYILICIYMTPFVYTWLHIYIYIQPFIIVISIEMSVEVSHIHSFWWVNVTYQPILVDQCINFVYIIIIIVIIIIKFSALGVPVALKFLYFCGICVDAFALLYLPELFWENILRKFQETHDQMVKACRNHVAQQLVAGQWMSVLPQPPQRPSPGVGVYRVLWKTASKAMHQATYFGWWSGWMTCSVAWFWNYTHVHWCSLMFIDVHWSGWIIVIYSENCSGMWLGLGGSSPHGSFRSDLVLPVRRTP